MQAFRYPAFRVSVIAIILFQLAALFARSMLQLALRDHGVDLAIAEDLSYLAVPPILLILMSPYLHRCRDALRQLWSTKLVTSRVVLVSVALGLTLRMTYWASLTFLIGIGLIGNDDPHAIAGPVVGFACPPMPVLALSLFVMSCLIPVIEETLNRGFILLSVLPRGTVPAVGISAISFALLHKPDTYLPAFLGGIVLAIQLLQYRTLWGPVIAHATYNAAAVIDWDCFRLVWNPETSDPKLDLVKWVSLPIVVTGVLVILFLVSKKMAGISSNASRPP